MLKITDTVSPGKFNISNGKPVKNPKRFELGQCLNIVTARRRSCGKVMFSVVSVCAQGGGECHVTITNDALDLTVQGLPPCPSPPSVMVAKAGDLFKLVHFRTPPSLLTSSGYGREASGMHPTVIFSCYRPQRSWGKVIFSQASVILLTGGHAWRGEYLTRQTPPLG